MKKRYFAMISLVLLFLIPMFFDSQNVIQTVNGKMSTQSTITTSAVYDSLLYTVGKYSFPNQNFTNGKTLLSLQSNFVSDSIDIRLKKATQELNNLSLINGSNMETVTQDGATGWTTERPFKEIYDPSMDIYNEYNITNKVRIVKRQTLAPDPELYNSYGVSILSGDNSSIEYDDTDYLMLNFTSSGGYVRFKINLTKHGINYTDVLGIGYNQLLNSTMQGDERGWLIIHGSNRNIIPRSPYEMERWESWFPLLSQDLENPGLPWDRPYYGHAEIFIDGKGQWVRRDGGTFEKIYPIEMITPDDCLFVEFKYMPFNTTITIDFLNFTVFYYESIDSGKTGDFVEVRETYKNEQPLYYEDWSYHYLTTQFGAERGYRFHELKNLTFQFSFFIPNDSWRNPVETYKYIYRDLFVGLMLDTDNTTYPRLAFFFNFSTEQPAMSLNTSLPFPGLALLVGTLTHGIQQGIWHNYTIDVLEYIKGILGYTPKITGISRGDFGIIAFNTKGGVNFITSTQTGDMGLVGSRYFYVDNVNLTFYGEDELLLANESTVLGYNFKNPKPYVDLQFEGVSLNNISIDLYGTKTYYTQTPLIFTGDFHVTVNTTNLIKLYDLDIEIVQTTGIITTVTDGVNQLKFESPPTGEFEIPDLAFTWQLSRKPDIVQIIEDGASHIANEGYWNYTGGTLSIYGKSFIADTISAHGSVKSIIINIYYSTADLKVSVSDSYGTPLEGIFVIARHHELGDLSFSITTNVNGIAFFQNVPNGRYDVITRKANEVALYTNFLLRDTGYIPLQVSIVYLQWWQIITLMIAVGLGSGIGVYLFSLYGRKSKIEATKTGKKSKINSPFQMKYKKDAPYFNNEKQQKKKNQEWF